MAIKLTTTKDTTTNIKCLVYGESGIGKTRMAKTCPKPLIISSEKKLISLKGFNIPVALVEDHEDLKEMLRRIKEDKKYEKFETIVLDSISDIAETILSYFQKNPEDANPHPQAAYGSMMNHLTPLIKQFRDLPDRHVYFIAKAVRMADAYTGVDTWMPAMPGQKMGPALPYLFDFVFPMRSAEDEDGEKYRYLQTEADIQWLAKGIESLDFSEEADLGKLFDKVLGVKKAITKKKPAKKKETVVEKEK